MRYAFERHLGITPTEYLRRVRLDRAHHDLAAGDPTTTTVREVALRWAYLKPSRFAEHYRAVYGVYPSHTLSS